MCFGSSKTETKEVELDPLSSEGRQSEAYMYGMLDASMSESGYYVQKTPVDKWNDEARALPIAKEVDDLKAQQTILQNKMFDLQNGAGREFSAVEIASGVPSREINSLQAQSNSISERIKDKEKQLDKIGKVQYDDIKIMRDDPPEVKNAQLEVARGNPDSNIDNLIQEHGFDSPEVRSALNEFGQSKEVNQLRDNVRAAEAEMSVLTRENTIGFMEKISQVIDYSADNVRETLTPVKMAISSMAQELNQVADMGYDFVMERMKEMRTEIDQTGMDTLDALSAVGVQIEQSGATMLETLRKVNESAENKAKFEFDLLSRKIDVKEAQRASLLGLAPGSEQEKMRSATIKQEALTQILLDLESEKMRSEMGIVSGVEAGKIDLMMTKANLAATQGGKKESLAGSQVDLAKALSDQKTGMKSMEASELIAMEKAQAEAIHGVEYGNVSNILGSTQQGLQLGNQNRSYDLSALLSGQGMASQMYGVEQNKNLNTGTTTVTSKNNVGLGTGIIGGIGAIGSTIGAIKTGGLFGGGK